MSFPKWTGRYRASSSSPSPSGSNGGRFQKFALLSSVGLMFPTSIAIGAAAGYFLDRRFDTFPWLSLLFFGLGVAAALINLVRVLRKFEES